MEKAGKQPFTELSLRDLYCIHTDMAALPKTDVHASAQRSQLFPNPSEYCCADSQILTHSAIVFKKYSPHTQKNKATSGLPLESTYFNRTCIKISRDFYYK